MPRLVRRAAAGIVVIAFACATRGNAQLPRGFQTLSARAVADSLRAIDSLTAHIRRQPNDAAALYRRGMIAWSLEMRLRHPNPPQMPSAAALRRTADQSLFAALSLDRTNGQRWLMMGHFYRSDIIGASAVAAREAFEQVIALAHAGGDSVSGAKAALILAGYIASDFGLDGRLPTPPDIIPFERDLPSPNRAPGSHAAPPVPVFSPRPPPVDPIGSRAGQPPPMPVQPAVGQRMEGSHWTLTGAETGCVFRAAGRNLALPLPDLLQTAIDSIRDKIDLPEFERRQEINYLTAQQYTALAHAFVPTDTHAFRGLASVLLARDEWADLNALGTDRARRVARDPWGWMVVGLARHRQGDSRSARAAFDSGMARMTPAERATLDRLDRVLSGADSAGFASGDSATRARTAGVSWLLADPLWSEDEEDPRLEFLARLTFAEIRWGRDDAVGVGAGSPNGAVYIRYGPPDEKRGGYWIYKSGVVLSQSMIRNSGRGCGSIEVALLAQIKAAAPAQWDNASRVKIDSMATQVARFRAESDSVDVFLAARAPMNAMLAVRTANTTMRTRMWVYSWTTPYAIEPAVGPDVSGVIRWVGRVAPGRYYYRVESTMPGTLVAGRTAANATFGPDSATGFSARGFGMSDVLLATRAVAAGAPQRWSEVDVAPLVGDVAKGSAVSLVWETYELERRNAEADYTVTITLERQRADSGTIAARIVSGVAGTTGIIQSDSALTMEFSRRVPHAPVIVDNVALALGETPPGTYKLTVMVKDAVSGRTVAHSTRINIRD